MVKKHFPYLTAGLTAILVGYSSSVVIVMQAAHTLGASSEQLASWLCILPIGCGLISIVLSLYLRIPILGAWSTPGAALIVSAGQNYSLDVAVTAFLLSNIGIVLTGFIKPLLTAISAIPKGIASAILAAVVAPFCLKAFSAIELAPLLFFATLLLYLFGKRFFPKYTMSAMLLLVIGYAAWAHFSGINIQKDEPTFSLPFWGTLTFVTPSTKIYDALNLAIPLYLVTMLSQNIPGMAVLNAHGYSPKLKPILLSTGGLSALFSFFGSYTLNLAAISAAICMNKDVDENKDQRYHAAVWGGVVYIIAGIFSGAVVSLFIWIPEIAVKVLAGFALLDTLLMSLTGMIVDKHQKEKESALLTFLICLSGISFLGINAIVVGIIVGISYKFLSTKQWAVAK